MLPPLPDDFCLLCKMDDELQTVTKELQEITTLVAELCRRNRSLTFANLADLVHDRLAILETLYPYAGVCDAEPREIIMEYLYEVQSTAMKH